MKRWLLTHLKGGKNPIYDRVIGGLILAVILSFVAIFRGWFYWPSDFVLAISNFLNTAILVTWAHYLSLVVVAAVMCVSAIVVFLGRMRRNPREYYLEDAFGALIWRWCPGSQRLKTFAQWKLIVQLMILKSPGMRIDMLIRTVIVPIVIVSLRPVRRPIWKSP